MENKLMIFENEAFGKMRTLNLNGEPWFVAVDVCSVLDLSNPTIAVSRLDEDERAKFNLGRQGDATKQGNIVRFCVLQGIACFGKRNHVQFSEYFIDISDYPFYCIWIILY